ncbi:MAG TPA: winged helix DNA-binding domain-containing protein [Gaiellaceae bacterium]|nr:winged helix DNA-binding domain-containing protein [Gaiellaceae bacterium]
MAERTLTQRELNRALLARQLLLERARLPIPRALERLGGIQDQYAPNAYIRLWSCLDGFERDDLTRALERRSAIQGTLMRGTIHVVSRRDYWPLAVAIRGPQRAWLLRTWRLTESELECQAGQLRRLLADGPRRADELSGPWDPMLSLVRLPPSGTWERRRANLIELAERWVGPEDVDEDMARDHLVRRYLGAFGPASRHDIAQWAGTKPSDLAAALERLRLRRFRDEAGGELLDLPRAPLPPADTPAPVRFLPTWDAVLLVHVRRAGVLPGEYRPRIFPTTMPQSIGTFLVDGSVAGTWKQADGRIEWTALRRLDRADAREVSDEAERLAEFHG